MTRTVSFRSAATAHVLAAALLVIASPPPTASARLAHVPASTVAAWTPLHIEVALTDGLAADDIAAADVVVRLDDGSVVEFPLAVSRGLLFGEIPAELLSPPEIEYHLRVVDVSGTVTVSPPGAPGAGAFRVPVADPTGAPAIEIVTPLPGELVAQPPTDIAAAFSPPLEPPWNVLVILDGRDVSTATDISSRVAVLSLTEALTPGRHKVTISALTPVHAIERTWSFVVGDATEAWPGDVADDRTRASDVGGSLLDESIAAEPWRTVGRVEVGWAVVVADTTEADTLDVALPYDEGNGATLDLYATGFRSDASYLLTARYDPVYADDIDWQAAFSWSVFELEAGFIYPSLSRTTLDWTSGLGGRAAVSPGLGHAEVVALRVSEPDTLAGFGTYARYALGAAVGYDWNDRFGLSVVHASILDDEDSIAEEDRISDPLTNRVTACVLRGGAGSLRGEVEVALSDASGEVEGSGVGVRARLVRGSEYDDHIALEFAVSDTGFYSAGSFEQERGETSLRIEGAWSGDPSARISGWMEASDDGDDATGGGAAFRAYARSDVTWAAGTDGLRSYAVARFDRTPGVDDDYSYAYASLGTTWRRGPARLAANASWSRSESTGRSDLWTLGAEAAFSSPSRTWTGRAAGRWSFGSGDDTDSTRSQYTIETTRTIGPTELRIEYWLIDRDDRADPLQSYTEHVLRTGLGYSF